jgi:hypothetical protein
MFLTGFNFILTCFTSLIGFFMSIELGSNITVGSILVFMIVISVMFSALLSLIGASSMPKPLPKKDKTN